MKRHLWILAMGWMLAGTPAGAETAPVGLDVWKSFPVLEGGRVMPLDSYARLQLLSLSGRSTYNREPAINWLARVLFTPADTRDDEIFLINHEEVAEALGLPAEGRRRYSYAQLEPTMHELNRLARAAFHLEESERSAVDMELMRVFHGLITYSRLTAGFSFAHPLPDLHVHNADLRRDLDLAGEDSLTALDLHLNRNRIHALLESRRGATPEEQTDYEEELFGLAVAVRMQALHREDVPPAIIPLLSDTGKRWVGPWDAILAAPDNEDVRRELVALRDLCIAYRDGNPASFDAAAKAFIESSSRRITDPKTLRNTRLELQLNRSDAFYRSQWLYGLAFLAVLISAPTRSRRLIQIAVALVIVAVVLQAYGIVARMFIMGRPPTTNLYSTFVFVSWSCAVLGLVTEYIQRNRLGVMAASFMGLSLLLVAGRFAIERDTMGVLMPVLNNNFWLATHVITITLGYAGCFVAALIAHVYLLQTLRRDPEDPAVESTYAAMYGAMAFGLIFTFAGTMIGGIWADQSWGRFWGWDPKENGALVIVLWAAILFHAKIAKMIGPIGFAAGSIICGIWVMLTWLGVNLLGVGLHAYGFTSGVGQGLLIYCVVEFLFVLLVTPFTRWQRTAAM